MQLNEVILSSKLKFNINTTLKKCGFNVQKRTKYSLIVTTESSKMFFTLVSPYIIKSLKYKLPKSFKNMPCIFDYINNYLYKSRALKFVKVKNISLANKKQNEGYIYDLQTQNENYFIGSNYLVHNSKIQNGCKYFGGEKIVDFILFDIKIGNWWLKREEVINIAKQLEIKVVPILYTGTIGDAIKYIKSGVKSVYGNFIAEGLVFLAEDLEVSGNYNECINMFTDAAEILHELGNLKKEKDIRKELERLKKFSKEMVEDEYIMQKFHVDNY